MVILHWILYMGLCISTCVECWRPPTRFRPTVNTRPNNTTREISHYPNREVMQTYSTNTTVDTCDNPHSIVYRPISQKMKSVARLIRANNLGPTAFLCFSGGWIMDPNLYSLIHSGPLYASTASTLLIMSSSMVINDLFDVSTDRINNPSRPLVTQEISQVEAIGYTVVMLSAAETINHYWVPVHLKIIVHAAIANILLYTPLWKRIPILKNLSCAILVSSSILFAGLSTAKDYSSFIHIDLRAGLLWAASFAVLMGSWQNEVLLDMCDVEGDRKNKIYTIPVIFGKNIAWTFVFILSVLNTFISTTNVEYLIHMGTSVPISIIYGYMIYNTIVILNHRFEKTVIVKMVKQTTIPLVLSLIYLCILSSTVSK